jgi:hypothetical protein
MIFVIHVTSYQMLSIPLLPHVNLQLIKFDACSAPNMTQDQNNPLPEKLNTSLQFLAMSQKFLLCSSSLAIISGPVLVRLP